MTLNWITRLVYHAMRCFPPNIYRDIQAIDAFFPDLPLVLHDGFISSVTARIPWPNPLTSTLGFSLESLHLTFHLRPKSNTPIHAHAHPILADSVASVAESFIHEELTSQEEATLFESFHPDLVSSIHSRPEHTLPGGLDPDPFLSNPEDDSPNSDGDPDGVSIFAAIFEQLLARFEFHAVNTKITVIQPGNVSLTVSIPEFRYRTEGEGISTNAPPDNVIAVGKSRTIAITGLTVTANNLGVSAIKAPLLSTLSPRNPDLPSESLHDLSPSSHSSRSTSPAPASPKSTSSEEDVPFEMSQSIACLPPLHGSPTGSMTSSMYQSAISTLPTSLNREYDDTDDETEHASPPMSRQRISESFLSNESTPEQRSLDVILSFASDPILIGLGVVPSLEDRGASTMFQNSGKMESNETVNISIATGIIACALQGWHIRAISDLAGFWTANQSIPGSSDSTIVAASQPDVTLSFKTPGLILLVLPPAFVTSISHRDPCLPEFFKQPLLSSTFPHGYIRLFLETINGSVTLMTRSGDAAISSGSEDHSKQKHTGQAITTRKSSFNLSISDISLFSFEHSRTPEGGPDLDASPILIADSTLPFQYASIHNHPDTNRKGEHPHLPTFQVVDRTDGKYRPQPALWRGKGSHKSGTSKRSHAIGSSPVSGSAVGKDEGSPSVTALTLNTAIQECFPRQRKPVLEVDVKVVPMHIFVDLGQVLRKEGNWSFLTEVIGDMSHSTDELSRSDVGEGVFDHQADTGDSEEVTPPATPRARSTREIEKERQRLEKLVLEDLDLDLDYRAKDEGEGQRRSRKVELCFSALF
jgi:autophagy-related protein 2